MAEKLRDFSDVKVVEEGYTYVLTLELKDAEPEVETWHVSRVHNRHIYFGVTAYSTLDFRMTRLQWRKMIEGLECYPLQEPAVGITFTKHVTTSKDSMIHHEHSRLRDDPDEVTGETHVQ